MTTAVIETRVFETASALKAWLDKFQAHELHVMGFTKEALAVQLVETTLTDGSIVANAHIKMIDNP